jgi:hypothetical protein
MDNADSEEIRKRLGYVGQNEEFFQEWLRRKEEFDKIYAHVNLATQDKDFLRLYDSRFMAFCDWTTSINTAFEKGLKEGRETARNALAEGASTESLCKKLPALTLTQ